MGKVISADILDSSESGLVRSAVFYLETIEDAQKVVNFLKDFSIVGYKFSIGIFRLFMCLY